MRQTIKDYWRTIGITLSLLLCMAVALSLILQATIANVLHDRTTQIELVALLVITAVPATPLWVVAKMFHREDSKRIARRQR